MDTKAQQIQRYYNHAWNCFKATTRIGSGNHDHKLRRYTRAKDRFQDAWTENNFQPSKEALYDAYQEQNGMGVD